VEERLPFLAGAVLLPLACSAGTNGAGAGPSDASYRTDAPVDAGTEARNLDAGVDVWSLLDARGDAPDGTTASNDGEAGLSPGDAGPTGDGSGEAGVGDAGDMGLDDGGVGPDDARFFPTALNVTALPGGNGVLDLIALTLRKGPTGPELYAAMRNDDPVTCACDPGLSVELYDKSGQVMGTWIAGLNTIHFYDVVDAGMLASCVGPGDVTMAAFSGLPSDLAVDSVGYVVYRCPYFALDVVPIDAGFAVTQVTSAAGPEGGTVFTGTFVNGFDASVTDPSVTVFPVNSVGRPLGVATASGTGNVDAGGSWPFQTNAVDVPGASFVAYPSASGIQ
jgi:hypothetical protein